MCCGGVLHRLWDDTARRGVQPHQTPLFGIGKCVTLPPAAGAGEDTFPVDLQEGYTLQLAPPGGSADSDYALAAGQPAEGVAGPSGYGDSRAAGGVEADGSAGYPVGAPSLLGRTYAAAQVATPNWTPLHPLRETPLSSRRCLCLDRLHL